MAKVRAKLRDKNVPRDRVAPAAAPAKVQPYKGNELPHGTIQVTTYKEYRSLIKKWGDGILDDTLLVLGAPGIGKSETALATLAKQEHCYIKGQATRYGVYLQLFTHKDEPVVLDDVDVMLNNKEVTGLLKMLLETRQPKIIQWTTGATLSDDSGVPPRFETRSRTLILANELRLVSKNFSAVLDRSTIIWFAPSADEIHKYTKTWFKDDDVYNFVGERIHATPSPSCRYYYHGAKWKKAKLPWQKMIGKLMLPPESKQVLCKELQKKHKTDKARVRAWRKATGESEQAYYATKKALGLAEGKRSKRSVEVSEGMKRYHDRKRAAAAVPAPAEAIGST